MAESFAWHVLAVDWAAEQVDNLGNSPDSTVQVATLPNNVPLTRPLEYDTWGRTVLLGFNYKL